MATVSIIAIAAAALIVAGIAWVALIFRLCAGPSTEHGAIGMVLCIPGLVAVVLGPALTVVNGFVAVAS